MEPWLYQIEPMKRTGRGLFGKVMSHQAILAIERLQGRREPLMLRYYDDAGIHYDWPYDYSNDPEYEGVYREVAGKIRQRGEGNLDFLRQLERHKLALLPEFLADPHMLRMAPGPKKAPEPEWSSGTAYIWPSYIVWNNDPSYWVFRGVPDVVELPKDVLRETTGHPEFRRREMPRYRSGLLPRGTI